MFYVYILYSKELDRFYIGQTENLDDRLYRHTNSGSKSTKMANDWVLKHKEEFQTRNEAVRREWQLEIYS
jgi:putative endonuclease